MGSGNSWLTYFQNGLAAGDRPAPQEPVPPLSPLAWTAFTRRGCHLGLSVSPLQATLCVCLPRGSATYLVLGAAPWAQGQL